jgi:hypothetical protein
LFVRRNQQERVMKEDKRGQSAPPAGSIPNRILGTLRDALAAASRDSTGEVTLAEPTELLPREDRERSSATPKPQSAAEAVKEAKMPPPETSQGEPTTRVLRGRDLARTPAIPDVNDVKTQVVRGKPKIAREGFTQDPVVGWLVIIGGPGLGSYRPIFEGNNAIGRSASQRIPLDFGDTSISGEEQAYIRYDSVDRSFLFVPNLAKTNVVAVNNKRPTGAVKLELMDVISVGRTQLAFVPFCSEEFDWSELAELKE